MVSTDDMPVAGFSFTDHTADVCLEVWGATLGEVFEQAALGLLSLSYEPSTVVPHRSVDVRLTAVDCELLLVDWCNELVYLVDGEQLALARPQVTSIGPAAARQGTAPEAAWAVSARVPCEPLDRRRHRPRSGVKAATMHGLSLAWSGTRWEGRVILDV